jgi:hypothetical protein
MLECDRKKGALMPKKVNSPEQIINKLRQAEVMVSQGATVAENPVLLFRSPLFSEIGDYFNRILFGVPMDFGKNLPKILFQVTFVFYFSFKTGVSRQVLAKNGHRVQVRFREIPGDIGEDPAQLAVRFNPAWQAEELRVKVHQEGNMFLGQVVWWIHVKTVADFHVNLIAACSMAESQEFGVGSRKHERGIAAVDRFFTGEACALPSQYFHAGYYIRMDLAKPSL